MSFEIEMSEIIAVELATGLSFGGKVPSGLRIEILACRPAWKACQTIGQMAEVYLAHRLAEQEGRRSHGRRAA